MATEPKKTQDDDPLQRAASQGFADPPTPEPTTEQLQRAMHPTDRYVNRCSQALLSITSLNSIC